MTATINQVREAMHTQPFAPFTVHLAVRRQYQVKHPDFIAYGPNLRELTVHDDQGVHLIDMRTVVELFVPTAAEPPEQGQ